jgi:prepilin-type N-terminal cleavage/methylation domain-containing protein
MNTLKLKTGFTLIELILTIVIMSILGVFGFSFFSFLTNTYVTMQNERGLQQEGAYIVERIARELRDASAVTTGTGSATITLQHTTPASGSTAAYALSGSILTRNTVPIGKNISSFAINTPTTSNCYPVSLTEARAGVTRTFQSTVCSRNVLLDTTGYKGNYYDTY